MFSKASVAKRTKNVSGSSTELIILQKASVANRTKNVSGSSTELVILQKTNKIINIFHELSILLFFYQSKPTTVKHFLKRIFLEVYFKINTEHFLSCLFILRVQPLLYA